MSEYKKWINTQDPNYNHKLCCISAEEHGMKEGWKAALEWVRDATLDPVTFALIKKELKNLD